MGSEIHEDPFPDAHAITRTDSAGLLHEPPHVVVRGRCWCLGGWPSLLGCVPRGMGGLRKWCRNVTLSLVPAQRIAPQTRGAHAGSVYKELGEVRRFEYAACGGSGARSATMWSETSTDPRNEECRVVGAASCFQIGCASKNITLRASSRRQEAAAQ